MDVRLADVCIGTSAAPTVLPAHYFETVDYQTGASHSFNIIDGGLVANNPLTDSGGNECDSKADPAEEQGIP